MRFAVTRACASDATLRLYNVLGRGEVRLLASGPVEGRQKRRLDVSGLTNGVYVLRLQAGGVTRTQRLTGVR